MITHCPSSTCRRTLPARIHYCAYCGTRQQAASPSVEVADPGTMPSSASTEARRGIAISMDAPLPGGATAASRTAAPASRSGRPVALMPGLVAVLLALGGLVVMMHPGSTDSGDTGGRGND